MHSVHPLAVDDGEVVLAAGVIVAQVIRKTDAPGGQAIQVGCTGGTVAKRSEQRADVFTDEPRYIMARTRVAGAAEGAETSAAQA